MNHFEKPTIVVSKCLEFSRCRYDGQMVASSFIKLLEPHVDFVPVCPEVEMGLGIPRNPIRLVKKNDEIQLLQPSTGKDYTIKMDRFNNTFFNNLKDVDGFILKSASPSCGNHAVKVYDDIESKSFSYKSSGLFSKQVQERFGHLAIEDEGRVNNLRIREHFLTKVFLFASFRKIKAKGRFSDLVTFHANNKLLLMAYHQTNQKQLGRIISNRKEKPLSKILESYETILSRSFAKNARYISHVNVLMHALGFFKKTLNSNEKKHFLDILDKYRERKASLSHALTILQSWVLRFDSTYLKNQTYLEPFPSELINLSDSGMRKKI
jgi:uncharacterized protein YbgA (DUF1722 family)/uncharacterized protein YbbK (DUF523 family)